MEGGGCVNTQTGSVRVAASQSNTVIPEASLVREEHVKVRSMSNSMSKRVVEIKSGISSSSRSLEADPINMESANPGVHKSEKLLTMPKYDIRTLPGGIFNLKLSSNSANIKKRSRSKHTSDISGREIQPSRTVVRGENENMRKFNNIPKVSMPTKRKQVFELSATDAKLQNILDNTHVILPVKHTSESPAKRIKWGQGGPE